MDNWMDEMERQQAQRRKTREINESVLNRLLEKDSLTAEEAHQVRALATHLGRRIAITEVDGKWKASQAFHEVVGDRWGS